MLQALETPQAQHIHSCTRWNIKQPEWALLSASCGGFNCSYVSSLNSEHVLFLHRFYLYLNIRYTHYLIFLCLTDSISRQLSITNVFLHHSSAVQSVGDWLRCGSSPGQNLGNVLVAAGGARKHSEHSQGHLGSTFLQGFLYFSG